MPRRCREAPPGDAGFSLVETLTAIAVMGVVMTALTTFFVSANNTLNKERGLQMAVRYAHDGVEMVRALPPGSIIAGRSRREVEKQKALLQPTDENDRVAKALQRELQGVIETMDISAAIDTTVPEDEDNVDNNTLATVPETPEAPTNNVALQRYWFVGACSMPMPKLRREDEKKPHETPCVKGQNDPLKFWKVVVVVVWQDSRACTNAVCTYSTQTLVTQATSDPVFNPSVTVIPPLPDNPGNQFSDVGIPIREVRLTASSSSPPYGWTADNLPPGLGLTSDGVIRGTPSQKGVYVVRVIVQDQSSSNDASFNWTVNELPAAVPKNQTWDAGAAVSYTLPVTGGAPPFTWSATGLPAGLSLDPNTGVVSGASMVSGAAAGATVNVRVVDSYNQASTASFVWNTKVQVVGPAVLTPTKGAAYSARIEAGGGTGVNTYTASNLPAGLSIASDGTISGTATATSRFLATITVRDSNGVTNSKAVWVNVAASGADLRITLPTGPAERANPKGTQLTEWTATAAGGTGTYTWTPSGLPNGVSVTFNAEKATFKGTPSATGTFTVKLTVTDAAKTKSEFSFQWTIT
ncbi:putative Ig domain-containing protein [Dactylosporangium sucinum]|uniref:Prepilin-type N-terminal cleavage/methylation domain-containing protein n=1 Tax=Dactylosporangium sucinum TaxID=1424081 RepID=A0A917WZ11_9ACTN|nr:putative Ig domain-containing protein [Dactylosporangium sucinum]GGM41642.1 hypothetical protein GCM10007977_048880 [Dactylosporangium sucinum]